jgi:hypothetical protein
MFQRKLQIFVSSTYKDLVSERLAAIEAILAAGHIPGAMEQFRAGDETAWEKIKRWIDNSDAYILILGARYGSLEPVSEKSYTHLEYEYALEKQKPFMALIITDDAIQRKVKEYGTDYIEMNYQDRLREFKGLVMSKHCAFWTDIKDIQVEVYKKLPEWASREDLQGWIRGEAAVNAETTNELARLSSENRILREQLKRGSFESLDGLTFTEMVQLLRDDENIRGKAILDEVIGVRLLNVGHLFDLFMDKIANGLYEFDVPLRPTSTSTPRETGIYNHRDTFSSLIKHNLAEYGGGTLYLSSVGRFLYNRLRLYGNQDMRFRELWDTSPSSEVNENSGS